MDKMKEILPDPLYFITGIDTDCGKSITTAFISKALMTEGVHTITQKLIQTGNPRDQISEDILTHRRIEQRALTTDDREGTTCPLIYTYPCSPHMAIAIDRCTAQLEKAERSTRILSQRYEKVLIEGAGGLMVPLTESYLTYDYIRDHQLPVILVTTAKLGSINQTLLNLYQLTQGGITIAAVAYNTGIYTDNKITLETRRYLRTWLSIHNPNTKWIEIPKLADTNILNSPLNEKKPLE